MTAEGIVREEFKRYDTFCNTIAALIYEACYSRASMLIFVYINTKANEQNLDDFLIFWWMVLKSCMNLMSISHSNWEDSWFHCMIVESSKKYIWSYHWWLLTISAFLVSILMWLILYHWLCLSHLNCCQTSIFWKAVSYFISHVTDCWHFLYKLPYVLVIEVRETWLI